MATVLDPLTPAQQRLVEIVSEVFLREQRWPFFAYVEWIMDQEGLDANAVLASFPTSVPLYGTGPYRAIWTDTGLPDRPVKLTILGIYRSELLHRSPQYPPIETTFFSVLRYFINLYRSFRPSPFEVPVVEAKGEELSQLLDRDDPWLELDTLFDLLKHEPATCFGTLNTLPDGSRRWSVTRHVSEYEGITDVPGYVDRFTSLAPPLPPTRRAVPSPQALPAALDYLDAIWLRIPGHSKSLLRLFSVQRTARLALPAETEGDLDGQLSALGEVLTSLDVPTLTPKPRAPRRSGADPTLQRLRAYLLKKVPASGHVRVNDAMDTLQDVIDLRHGSHQGHSKTRSKAAAAYGRLGIRYPPSSPAQAWEIIQAETVAALEQVREEIAPLTR